MGNGLGVENTSYTAEGMKVKSLDGTKEIIIRSFDVDNKSDRIERHTKFHSVYIGIVLYGYDGKSNWYCNGRSCKSGFVLLVKLDKIKYVNTKYWNSSHAKLYKWYFGVDPDYTKIVGGGFAFKDYDAEIIREGKVIDTYKTRGFVYNSSTFNSFNAIDDKEEHFKNSKFADYKEEYHDTKRAMNKIEQHWVEEAIKAWEKNGHRSKPVYCNSANWEFRKNESWVAYDHIDSVAIEKEHEIYKKKRREADSYEKFDEKSYYFIRRMRGTKYYIYFNAPHIKEDMFGYTSSDGYQKSEHGCLRAIYRTSNDYTGAKGTCLIM